MVSESFLTTEFPLGTAFGLILPFLVWLGFAVPAMGLVSPIIGDQHVTLIDPLILFALYAVTTNREGVFRTSGTLFVIWGLLVLGDEMFALMQTVQYQVLGGLTPLADQRPLSISDMVATWWNIERSWIHL